MNQQTHQDFQELKALQEEARIYVGLHEKYKAAGDRKEAGRYELRLDKIRRQSNVICERLWPAVSPYGKVA